jgi:hypothetical protein
MQKTFITLCFVALTLVAKSQINSSDEIVAEGVAKLKITPDIAAFLLTMEKLIALKGMLLKN